MALDKDEPLFAIGVAEKDLGVQVIRSECAGDLLEDVMLGLHLEEVGFAHSDNRVAKELLGGSPPVSQGEVVESYPQRVLELLKTQLAAALSKNTSGRCDGPSEGIRSRSDTPFPYQQSNERETKISGAKVGIQTTLNKLFDNPRRESLPTKDV